jgi:CRISPR-associated protein Cmr5
MSLQTREQKWALHAYACVRSVLSDQRLRKEYKPLANSFGGQVMRNGLAAALAYLERREGAAELLLGHLAAAKFPGLQRAWNDGAKLPDEARRLGLEEYMLATREALRFSVWLRRAVQALLKDEQEPDHA